LTAARNWFRSLPARYGRRTLIALALSRQSGALAARIGPRLQLSAGPILIGLGFALFVLVGRSGNYLTEVLPGVVVLGFGLVATVAPLTSTVLAAVSANHADMASAVTRRKTTKFRTRPCIAARAQVKIDCR